MYPIECVVRGYLVGSGWLEYQATQTVCGIPLPAGLANGDRLPEPIYTPAFKAAQGEHDENITFERTVELVGESVATALRDASLEVFARASAIAEARGIILADTKFEWGDDPATGALTLGDEVLTSDSSRYWDADAYETGDRTASFDKQIVRNWLLANWDQQGTPPTLPAGDRRADRCALPRADRPADRVADRAHRDLTDEISPTSNLLPRRLRIDSRWPLDPRSAGPSPRPPEGREAHRRRRLEQPRSAPGGDRSARGCGMAAASIRLYGSMSEQLAADTAMGPVTLKVGDLDAMTAYYRDAVQLQVLFRGSGVGDPRPRHDAVMVLEHAPELKHASPRDAGLFHTAILFDTEAALAAVGVLGRAATPEHASPAAPTTS